MDLRALRVLAIALGLTACGDSGPSASPPEGPAPPAPGPPEPACGDLAADAGYVEVPASGGVKSRARLFWTFAPAATCATRKPLFVVFNGGPGYPTSVSLALRGIGPKRLTPAGKLEDNPASFTKLGNLLFVDTREAGFSYSVGDPARAVACGTQKERDDAADSLLVATEVLRKLPVHPKRKIVLVGESYGGTRVQEMLELAFAPDAVAQDFPELAESLRAYYAAALGEPAPSAAKIGAVFGDQVLLQPLVAGAVQVSVAKEAIRRDAALAPFVQSSKVDPYQIDRPASEGLAAEAFAVRALGDLGVLQGLFGRDPKGLLELVPAGRSRATRVARTTTNPDVDALNEALSGALGALGRADRYYDVVPCPGYIDWEVGLGSANTFLKNLVRGRVFITNARKDVVVYTPAIPEALATQAKVPLSMGERGGGPRPQTFDVTMLDGVVRTVRFPTYEQAGHAVAERMGGELRDDVEAWLAASGAAP
jgi:hypothetical protein